MALEFICSQTIEKGMLISLPNRDCNHFDILSRRIRLYAGSPKSPDEKRKRPLREIPKNSAQISFEGYHQHKGWVNYGEPTFYDSEGNIINAGGEI